MEKDKTERPKSYGKFPYCRAPTSLAHDYARSDVVPVGRRMYIVPRRPPARVSARGPATKRGSCARTAGAFYFRLFVSQTSAGHRRRRGPRATITGVTRPPRVTRTARTIPADRLPRARDNRRRPTGYSAHAPPDRGATFVFGWQCAMGNSSSHSKHGRRRQRYDGYGNGGSGDGGGIGRLSSSTASGDPGTYHSDHTAHTNRPDQPNRVCIF